MGLGVGVDVGIMATLVFCKATHTLIAATHDVAHVFRCIHMYSDKKPNTCIQIQNHTHVFRRVTTHMYLDV
jgi:hypothetical protein